MRFSNLFSINSDFYWKTFASLKFNKYGAQFGQK